MSIKRSLKTSILLMSVIPVILMALLAYIAATTKYGEINRSNVKHQAKDYSSGFVSQIEVQTIETKALANLNDVKSFLLEKVNSPDLVQNSSSTYYTGIYDTLTQISDSFDNNVNYYIYDIDGYLALASSKDSTADWNEIMPKDITEYSEKSIIPHSRFNKNTLDIIVPVSVKDHIVGLIRCNINADYFGSFLSDNNNYFVLDEKGACLFNYHLNSNGDAAFLDYITQLSDAETTETDASDTEADALTNDTYVTSHDKYIYGYCVIPNYNWVYVIKENTNNYTAIVSSLPIIFLILLIIVAIISFQISHSLSLKYSEPIIELGQKMQEAANGQLSVHCQIDRKDEFGTLSDNFNQMMDIISTNYNEISEARKELEANQIELEDNYRRIEKLAYTDSLTGLYNRAAFFKYANEILSDNKGGLKNHAVIFIDLDGFKTINDTLGHDYGDLLLQEVTKQIACFTRPDDVLARNGGDEFVILRNRIDSMTELEHFLEQLISIANHPFILDDETVHITLSAGVAMFPQNGLSLSELMKNADIAMYSSKNSGKNSYTFFDSTMEDEANRRTDLIDILRDAITNHDVYLLYQPQADISTGEIIGCEALMRLNSPIVGFVSPDEFIPVAEECGLIDELGEWALLEACQFNQRLIDAGFHPLRISVNVSTAQLRGNRLIKAIESLPDKTNMPLEYLEIELTESVLMQNFEHNLALINRMKELGIHIALDDFGTGYSSFSYLTKIPINTLKIDKSFIAGICENENDTYITGTIITLAHHLGISVIAEGVETLEQLRILQNQMCDVLQGYFFSRAISEKDFVELLKINS